MNLRGFEYVDVTPRNSTWKPENPKEYVKHNGAVIIAYCSYLNKFDGNVSRTLEYRITTDKYDWYSDKDDKGITHLHEFESA